MMKRLIALLMALAMVLGLTACAKEEATAEDLQVASYKGTVLTNSQLQYWFWDAYYEFLDVYGYGYYFDPAQPLNEQMLTETNTWEDYFLSSCINQWVTIQMLYGEAVKAGHQMPAELQAELDDLYESRRRRAIERASMTEEEQIAAMTADLEAVLADALENGMDIVAIPEDEDEEI